MTDKSYLPFAEWFKLPLGERYPYPKELQKLGYETYLKSESWRQKKYYILRRDNNCCQRCGYQSRWNHIHHLTYERIYQEHEEDLITLCERCHKKEHNINGDNSR